MTDDEIKIAILRYFEADFQNFRGDNLFEGPCNCDENDYDRAIELLPGARIEIVWNDEKIARDPRLGCHCLELASREFRPGVDEPPY